MESRRKDLQLPGAGAPLPLEEAGGGDGGAEDVDDALGHGAAVGALKHGTAEDALGHDAADEALEHGAADEALTLLST